MKTLLTLGFVILLANVPAASACSPTFLFGRATQIADAMDAMKTDSTISPATIIEWVEIDSNGFVIVHASQSGNLMCYTYLSGFNGNCTKHGATLWSSGPCP